MSELSAELRERIENTIRFLAVDAIEQASSRLAGSTAPPWRIWRPIRASGVSRLLTVPIQGPKQAIPGFKVRRYQGPL